MSVNHASRVPSAFDSSSAFAPVHAATSLGASPTDVGATLAVVGLMTRTLGTAGVADPGAKLAEFLGKSAAAAHQRRCEPADIGAIAIQPNAFGHHLDVLLLEAGGRTMFAFHGTGLTGFDAIGVQIVSHGFYPR